MSRAGYSLGESCRENPTTEFLTRVAWPPANQHLGPIARDQMLPRVRGAPLRRGDSRSVTGSMLGVR
jgi:hypothetical protein